MSTIRVLSSPNVAAFQALRVAALTSDPQAFLSVSELELQKTSSQFSQELLFSSLTAPFGYYGFFVESKLIGYAQLGTTGLPKQKHIGYLYNLYFASEYRGQGLATELMEFLFRTACDHSLEQLFTVCLANNSQGLRFYQRLGFAACGKRSRSVKWHDSYDDEIELVKVL